MFYRMLGSTGMRVSAIGFGAWAIGGSWGNVNDQDSYAALNRAVDLGINFFDTADVYGNGRSETLLGRLRRERASENIYIATKIGRRLDPHVAEGYTPENLMAFVDQSLKNLGMEQLDLVQLHCPPGAVYDDARVFDTLDKLKRAGKIRSYGVSVERISEALKAIEYPGVQTVQIIFNMFRQRPITDFFPIAKERNIGIIARVPLASGLLTGKMSPETHFAENDHRNYNRNGEAFDKGETFSGVDFKTGLKAVEELKMIKPVEMTMAQFALRWILMFDAVSCTIPGAKNPRQVEENAAAADFPQVDSETMREIEDVYNHDIREQVHALY